MLGLVCTLGGTDYTKYLQSFQITSPCTQAVSTATLIFDNTSGLFVNIPLKSAVIVSKGGTNLFQGVTESQPYQFDKSKGHTVQIDCTSCYELTTLVEGSLQPVGTNLIVNTFGNYGNMFQTTLAGTLASGQTYGTLSVNLTNVALADGLNITLTSGTNIQTVTASVAATLGASNVYVNSFTANANYPLTTNVSTRYIPYPSIWAGSTLNANLMDIGDVFAGLIHNVQPNQTSGYRGRLGYDVTDRGISTQSFDVATTNVGNGYETNIFVKGMWYVGPGSVGYTTATSGSGATNTSLTGSGREQFGIDLLKSLCQGNLIDINGNPQFIDFYYNPITNQVVYFKRGSVDSGVTFKVGKDNVQELQLPVDITDVKNDLVLWFNNETAYPADMDGWSNFAGTVLATTTVNVDSNSGQKTLNVVSSTGFVLGQGVNIGAGTARSEDGIIASKGTGTITLGANLQYTHTAAQADVVKTTDLTANWPNVTSHGGNLLSDASNSYLGYGWSNKFTSNAATATLHTATFNLGTNGYQNLVPTDSLGNMRNISAIKFAYMSTNAPNLNDITVVLLDVSGSNSVSYDFGSHMGASPLVWFLGSIPVPASGRTGWTLVSGAWDFATTTIGQVQLQVTLASNTPAINLWIDSFYFVDNYYYSPVYNDFGPTFSGQGSGLNITYNNNSITAYGDRIYNWNDYYNSGSSDSSGNVATNLLLSRRMKQASGTLKVYNPPLINSVYPGSIIHITDAKDTFIGTTYDSTITGWIVESIEYDYDAYSNGFIGIFTVEPYYASFNGINSPDTNNRNPFAYYRKDPAMSRAHFAQLTKDKTTIG
jgi:hypothetical protein